LKSTVLRLPLVERRARDPVPSADFLGLSSGLVLPKYPDDLLLAKPASLHCRLLFSGDGLYLNLAEFSGGRPMRFAKYEVWPPNSSLPTAGSSCAKLIGRTVLSSQDQSFQCLEPQAN